MAEQAVRPLLNFEIDSAGAASTIYVTADASVNDITLKITSTAAGLTVFTPAAGVVDKSQAAAATGSLLYLTSPRWTSRPRSSAPSHRPTRPGRSSRSRPSASWA